MQPERPVPAAAVPSAEPALKVVAPSSAEPGTAEDRSAELQGSVAQDETPREAQTPAPVDSTAVLDFPGPGAPAPDESPESRPVAGCSAVAAASVVPPGLAFHLQPSRLWSIHWSTLRSPVLRQELHPR